MKRNKLIKHLKALLGDEYREEHWVDAPKERIMQGIINAAYFYQSEVKTNYNNY